MARLRIASGHTFATLAFLDEEDGAPVPEPAERPRRRRRGSSGGSRRSRSPGGSGTPGSSGGSRSPFVFRRLIGVVAGLIFLALVVLAFRGCLDARKERGMRNYTSDVATIMDESEQRGKDFFELLDSSSSQSSVDLEAQVNSIRGASQSLLDRAENLDPPGEMDPGNQAILETLRLRRDALVTIGENISPATAQAEQQDPIAKITDQMKVLFASDVIYSQIARPEIEGVIEENGVTGARELPPGNFMPEGTAQDWLDQTRVSEALGGVSSDSSTVSGSHGLGLLGASIGGVALDPTVPVTVPSDASEVEVQVQNQGEAEESEVEVTVTVGDEPVTQTIPTIGPGETQTVKLALTTLPSPGSQSTVDVEVADVPGEADSSNNSASYTVTFG